MTQSLTREELKKRYEKKLLQQERLMKRIAYLQDRVTIVAAMRSVLIVGKLKKDPDVRVMTHEKSSLAANGVSLAFHLDGEDGFTWIGEYDATADELLGGTGDKQEKLPKPGGKTEAAQAFMRAILADGKKKSCEEIDRIALEKGIKTRTLRDARSKIKGELGFEKTSDNKKRFWLLNPNGKD